MADSKTCVHGYFQGSLFFRVILVMEYFCSFMEYISKTAINRLETMKDSHFFIEARLLDKT